MIRRPPRSPLFPSTPLSRSGYSTDRIEPPVPAVAVPIAKDNAATEDAPMPTSAAPDGFCAVARIARPVHVRFSTRSEEHTSELQSRQYLVCRLLLEKKKKNT